jgi:hypothetical protein
MFTPLQYTVPLLRKFSWTFLSLHTEGFENSWKIMLYMQNKMRSSWPTYWSTRYNDKTSMYK